MYHKVNIQKLSKGQIAKLLRGQRIRVKHGQGHVVNLSTEQAKKIMSAHKKGCGATIMFDPYQMDMHRGQGFFDNVVSVAKTAGKAVAPILIDEGSKALKGYIAGNGWGAPGPIFDNTSDVLKYNLARARAAEGQGFMGDVFKKVAPALVDVGVDALKKTISGSGKKKVAKKGGKKGKKGGALFNAGYSASTGQGALGGIVGSALGDIFLPF